MQTINRPNYLTKPQRKLVGGEARTQSGTVIGKIMASLRTFNIGDQ